MEKYNSGTNEGHYLLEKFAIIKALVLPIFDLLSHLYQSQMSKHMKLLIKLCMISYGIKKSKN